MKIVVGLGNPGAKYHGTRHNVGFLVLAELAKRHSAGTPKIKFEADVADLMLGNEKVLLVAPQTFMNLSGRSVGGAVDFYQLPLQDLLIVCDDMNLDLGRIRLRGSGSAGGQNGLKDIIQRLGTEEFARLRIGVGRPPGQMSATAHVLGKFRPDEAEPANFATLRAADAVEVWVKDGLAQAMNRFNRSEGDGPDAE